MTCMFVFISAQVLSLITLDLFITKLIYEFSVNAIQLTHQKDPSVQSRDFLRSYFSFATLVHSERG